MDQEFTKPGTPVSEQAAAWLIELADRPADLNTNEEFVIWLKRSPQHIEAFLETAILEQELSGQSGQLDDVLATVESMRANPAVPIDGGVPRVDSGTSARHPEAAARRRRYGWPIGALAAGVAVLAVAVLRWSDTAPPLVVHKTDFGEQRSIALHDGSIVTLNTRSELGVRFGEHERRVELVSGEAMFDVAKNQAKPFIVEAGSVAFRVLGTRFSVYRQPHSVRLAVVDGVVRVESEEMPDEPILVRAGEGAIASANGTVRRAENFNLDRATAWMERRLVFDDAPLSEVVREFNRYNRVPLVVEDNILAARTITSVFNANDVSALVGFLELEADVEVDYDADAIRIRVRR